MPTAACADSNAQKRILCSLRDSYWTHPPCWCPYMAFSWQPFFFFSFCFQSQTRKIRQGKEEVALQLRKSYCAGKGKREGRRGVPWANGIRRIISAWISTRWYKLYDHIKTQEILLHWRSHWREEGKGAISNYRWIFKKVVIEMRSCELEAVSWP